MSEWKLVPVEPIAKMMRAFWLAGPYPEKPWRDGYHAMLEHAPQPDFQAMADAINALDGWSGFTADTCRELLKAILNTNPSKWTVTHNGESVTADTLSKAMIAAQSLRTEEEQRVATENLLRRIDEEMVEEQAHLEILVLNEAGNEVQIKRRDDGKWELIEAAPAAPSAPAESNATKLALAEKWDAGYAQGRQEALEEAAKVCDGIANYSDYKDHWYYTYYRDGASQCVKSIRALIEQHQSEHPSE